jgi:dihydroorotase
MSSQHSVPRQADGLVHGSVVVSRAWLDGRLHDQCRMVAERGVWTSIESVSSSDPGEARFEGVAVGGLVDLHAHFGRGPYALLSTNAVEPGVVAMCSQGDAGPDTLVGWFAEVEGLHSETFIALNLAADGEAWSGCFDDFDRSVARRAESALRAHPVRVPMLAVNLSERSLGGADADEVLREARHVSDAVGRPLMLALAPDHVMPIADQLSALRAGDIVTYCYRSHPWCLFPTDGPNTALVESVDRGVLLDVAHGSEAFNHEVASRAISWGFAPHIISSGRKVAECGHPDPPSFAEVIARVVSAGMPVDDAIAAATTRPAGLLGVESRSPRVGEPAHLAIIGVT